ncbi:hypothetical protein [Cellulomonas dongxiuzhuiae]|nr:hypothetical protein [Cellulomonas dongxiuzhuiae]
MSELVVVMFVLSIIVIATMTLTVTMQRTNAQTMNRQEQIDGVRFAMDRISRTLRSAVRPSQLSTACATCTADAFVSGQQFAVQFYANVESTYSVVVPSRVTYSVAATGPTAGVLVERVQEPDQGTPTASGWTYCDAEAAGATAACKARLQRRTLATGVRATGTPMFAYYANNNTALSAAGTGLAATELATVMAVEVQLTATSTGVAAAQPTTIVQRVLLTNPYTLLRPDPGATP